MNIKRTLLTLLAAACMVVNASAILIQIGDTRDLGLIDPNHPADPSSSAGYVDILLDQALGTGPTTIGANAYTRTLNDPLNGNYPNAIFNSEIAFTGGNINLGQAGFLYLLAKYDGPNFGSEVFYIGGLTGANTIPLTAEGFGLSHVYLFNPSDVTPNPTGNGVPDGGSTVALLGLALLALGGASRMGLA
jgi:hypothetical protein